MTGQKDTEILGETAGDKGGKLDNRLEQLDAELSRLKEDQATDARKQSQQQSGATSLALAWRLGSEFIAGVLVGGGVGFLIDTWFGLAPWGLIIFLLLGFLAGMLNMLRSAGKIPPPGA
ncbi:MULTISPECIES: AtpZ/AtpI family protein [Cohaesibacter]|uniref:AtpZ/AtpI family protein n=1 Tax=Cohaesibacter TaxID=655352 RepID=UPI000DE88227|nr:MULTISPECIES: AtpZ/AtpI family protein [Cohaesibacter]TLP45464.1 F0F1 ATP synthase assembly protein I [Cohaesibacter sp. CAU 1516]